MIVGNFNLHQILFSLEMFEKKEDKLGYLYKMAKELQRIIRCFESSKTLPLRMYAVDNIQIDGNCDELKVFIRKQFKAANNPWEKRTPDEGKLKISATKEVIDYKKILLLIDNEIQLIENRTAHNTNIDHEPEKSSIKVKDINYSSIASLLKKDRSQIIWEHSIGELIELVNSILDKKLIKNLNENNLPQFISKNFVDKDESNYSLEKIEKVYSMFLKTIWSSKTDTKTRYFQ